MVGAPYYRTEAERCRKQAADDPASESAKRWLQLAAEYQQLADALEAEGGAPVVQRSPMQQQSMQQQQSKAEDEP